MTIELKQIQKLASLSRLEFPAEKLPAFAAEFQSIVGFVDKIQQLKTEGVPPLTSVANLESTPERPDVVTAPNNREALQKSAVAAEMGFYSVPRIVE
ncbi:MAG: Asp-tRNA(Asn)/Glu-tRNA(Gln) amidotransferase subunit GatC [Proteobacteria bacterium]|nr:Asp-tRNA(Asn)/Glu-tRNA(Gln) amidotransferase subunit GatC [Pseudomonadota bacterium]